MQMNGVDCKTYPTPHAPSKFVFHDQGPVCAISTEAHFLDTADTYPVRKP